MVVAMVGTYYGYGLACRHARSRRGSCFKAKQVSEKGHAGAKVEQKTTQRQQLSRWLAPSIPPKPRKGLPAQAK
jgi:hypothetical protein